MDYEEPVSRSCSFSCNQTNKLFDESQVNYATKSSTNSLDLMANCVYIVNATILRERKLLPAHFFQEFAVYGDVTGYLADRSHKDGEKLANKLCASAPAIRSRLVQKLAIVIEESLNTTPLETFIWNFQYGSSNIASAEIGYKSQKTKFTVDFNNMDETIQQFCKLFCELQDILKNLLPLPQGMIPSMKIAYRGDPEFVEGFERIDEFVNIEEILLGAIPFPHGHGFQFSYASKFMVDQHQQKARQLLNDIAPIQDRDFDMSSESQMEVVRQNSTMNFEEEETPHFSRPCSPIPEDVPNDANVTTTSMNCNPNIMSKAEEMRILQSEYNELVNENIDQNREKPGFISSDKVPVHKGTLKKQSQKAVVLKSHVKKRSLKVVSEKKVNRRGRNGNDKAKTLKNKETVVQEDRLLPKRNSRRLSSSPSVVLGREKSDHTEADKIDALDASTKSLNFSEKCHSTRRFSRVSSLLDLANLPESELIAETNGENSQNERNVARFEKNGHRTSLVNKEAMQIDESGTESQELERFGRISNIKAHTEEISGLSIKRNFGVVPSLKDLYDYQKGGEIARNADSETDFVYGKLDRMCSILDLDNARVSEKGERDKENSATPGKQVGRVPSVFELERSQIIGENKRVEEITATLEQQYGRVASILELEYSPMKDIDERFKEGVTTVDQQFGRVPSILELEYSQLKDDDERVKESVATVDQKFGRVPSVLELEYSQLKDDDERDKRNHAPLEQRFGRVSSIAHLDVKT